MMKSAGPLRPNSPKRNDIQILRAYSVLTVLMFHLRPKWVPNGFLAVDIFFVISGYLMAKILNFGSNEAHFTLLGTLNFYNRRFKRLVPTYVFIVFLTSVIGSVYLIPTDFKSLATDVKWALGFGSNVQTMIKTQDYFKMTSEFAFLLHSWSLSVEAQFYLLSPFLFAVLSIRWPLFGLISATVISCGLQTFYVDDIYAFNFMFCRVWQFLIGGIVFYAEKRRNHLDGAVWKLVLARLLLIGCTLWPQFSTSVAPIRILATVSAGLAVYAGKYGTAKVDKGFWVGPLTYIGDASYSIYLVHWPVIVFCKYFGVFETVSLPILIFIIFALSLLTHHYFEKPVGNFTLRKTALICLAIYILAIFSTYFQSIYNFHSKIILENDRISQTCNHVPELDACNWDPEILEIYPKSNKSASFACSYKGHGNATVFVTGNSFALRQVKAVRAALNGNYKKLYFVARPGCITFDRHNDYMHPYYQCWEIRGKVLKFLKKIRPDVLVMTQLLHPLNEARPKNETDEQTVEHLKWYFRKYAAYTKAIVHIEPHHRFWYSPPLAVARYLAQGKDLYTLGMPEDHYKKTPTTKRPTYPSSAMMPILARSRSTKWSPRSRRFSTH
uniref:Acyltransferase n=1 Tax=Panagrellus redivivus TaxID=6233 RepID=A0A7E4W315_PANRE